MDRSILLVWPKLPFHEWLRAVDEDEPPSLDELREDPTAFLVRVCEFDWTRERIVREYFDAVFEHELSAWFTDEELWPPVRDLETFHRWFDHQVVVNLFDADDL